MSMNCSIVMPTPPKLIVSPQNLQIKDKKLTTFQTLPKDELRQSSMFRPLRKSQMIMTEEKIFIEQISKCQMKSKDDLAFGKLVINMRNKTVSNKDFSVYFFLSCLQPSRNLQ